jgi:transcriptional regulator with XRE-family HTH domain
MNKIAIISNGTKVPAKAAKRPRGPRGPSHFDDLIGTRVKAARLRVGISQQQLGEKLGVSFQQVQKYEKGANRISVSRLPQIADALGVSISEFYSDLKVGKKDQIATAFERFLATKDGTDLVHAVLKIDDPKHRRMVVHIARVLAGEELRG